MNWIHAVRMCGGDLTDGQIERVRDRLDALGYETELDSSWIGELRRGSSVIWRVEYGIQDGLNAVRFMAALHPSALANLNQTFGQCSLAHLDFPSEYDEEDDEQPTLYPIPRGSLSTTKVKPIVGAATKLPLPR